MRWARAVTGAVALAALALAACGGGGSGAAPQISSDPDQALAEEALLRLDDLGGRWEETGQGVAIDDRELSSLGLCAATDGAGPVRFGDGRAVSQPFSLDGATVVVTNQVDVFAAEADAEQLFDRLTSDATVECLRGALAEQVQAQFADDPDLGPFVDRIQTRVGRADPGPVDGSESDTLRVVVETLDPLPTGEAVEDVMVVRQGRAVATFTSISASGPYAGGDRSAMAAGPLARLRAGLAGDASPGGSLGG